MTTQFQKLIGTNQQPDLGRAPEPGEGGPDPEEIRQAITDLQQQRAYAIEEGNDLSKDIRNRSALVQQACDLQREIDALTEQLTRNY